ncbi:hypothetical protein BCR33DRAFT_511598 [Rhizoclosmatium globosum]|uniref:DDE Tnp4 domain-containing protein n=1 Tax=Rhizoclosmatium globosum TaxID=329046 RepID=A0A1Y2BHB4_9FUNG|nr:hypothetical protein BCR33DRAFT_511598 [Rhizoclosmatium globosum]|eukprot:ORY34188.1 hypothetical protein BCR33DRAFT_511598 [Rhizoclosmatium globosum]
MLVLFHLLKQRHLAQERRHNRQQKRQLAMMLRIKLSIRTRHFIKTTSLGNANASAWQHLYHGPDEGSFVVSTSLTRAAFQTLLAEFSKHYNVKSGPGKAGRPPKATYKSTILGLLLCFYTGTSDGASLCREFAMPPSTLYRVLHNAEVALDKALRSLKDAQIRWPTYAEQVEWGWLVERKESVVKCKFGFVDGKNFRVQQPSHQDLQNAMYNGWLHSVLVTGVLAFGVDGCIFWMKHNCPGSWNDAEMSRDFRKKLLDDRRTMPEYGVTADSAFPASSDMFEK